jgi:diguanylate cyclase (GGDEF)-like protein
VESAVRFHHPLAALFVDIDHFKLFNDEYSYAVGDQVLRLCADSLRLNLREVDLVGRYGGEEFVILLPEADLKSASEVAERVRRSIEALRVKTEQGDASITVSIGVCQKTPALIDLEALLERAGQVLHIAKQRGRNQVAVE